MVAFLNGVDEKSCFFQIQAKRDFVTEAELMKWMSAVLGRTLEYSPADPIKSLKSGIALCE